MADKTILVADDHPLIRDAFRIAIEAMFDDVIVLEACSIGDALDKIAGCKALDLILLDLRMPDAEGFSGLALIHAEQPDVPILVVSAAESASAAAGAKRYGAVGFLSKSADIPAIRHAITAALAGDSASLDAHSGQADAEVDAMAGRIASLTSAQLKVMLGVLAGRLNKQIAYDLGISEATVKAHMTAVMRKLNVQNRTQAVLAARALSIAPDAALQ